VHEAIQGYYPEHLHAELAALLGTTSDALGDEFIEKISVVLFILDSDLLGVGRERETLKLSRAALKRLQRQVCDIKASLADLDVDASFALAQSLFDEFGPSLTDEESEKYLSRGSPIEHGLRHLDNSVLQLQKLGDLIEPSIKLLGGKGRPRKDYARHAVEGLHRIWISITNTKPTRTYALETGETGRFLSFCELLLRPKLGNKISLEYYVRKAIEREK